MAVIIASNVEELEERFPTGKHRSELFAYLRSLSKREKRRQLESLEENNEVEIADKCVYAIEKKPYSIKL